MQINIKITGMNVEKLTIKDWDEQDQPREKLMNNGAKQLSNAEIIAILIGSGNRDESAVELCKRILSDVNNNLNELSKLTLAQLQKYKGIGEAKAITIAAALELGSRFKAQAVIERKCIGTSFDAYEYFNGLAELDHEEVWVMVLSRKNQILEARRISEGGVSSSVVDIKIILRFAIEKLASGIILCHNHPSGNLKPSEQDDLLTERVAKAASFMDIKLLDHIVIAGNKYYSYADEEKIV